MLSMNDEPGRILGWLYDYINLRGSEQMKQLRQDLLTSLQQVNSTAPPGERWCQCDTVTGQTGPEHSQSMKVGETKVKHPQQHTPL